MIFIATSASFSNAESAKAFVAGLSGLDKSAITTLTGTKRAFEPAGEGSIDLAEALASVRLAELNSSSLSDRSSVVAPLAKLATNAAGTVVKLRRIDSGTDEIIVTVRGLDAKGERVDEEAHYRRAEPSTPRCSPAWRSRPQPRWRSTTRSSENSTRSARSQAPYQATGKEPLGIVTGPEHRFARPRRPARQQLQQQRKPPGNRHDARADHTRGSSLAVRRRSTPPRFPANAPAASADDRAGRAAARLRRRRQPADRKRDRRHRQSGLPDRARPQGRSRRDDLRRTDQRPVGHDRGQRRRKHDAVRHQRAERHRRTGRRRVDEGTVVRIG